MVEPTDIPGALVDHLAAAHDDERLERVRLLERSDLELVAMRLLELLDQPRDNVSLEARAQGAVTTGDLAARLKDIPDDLPVELGVIVDGLWRTAFLVEVEHVFDSTLNRDVCELLANDEPPRKWTADTDKRVRVPPDCSCDEPDIRVGSFTCAECGGNILNLPFEAPPIAPRDR